MQATITVRGIEHVGITVPDITAASKFLVDAFGAEILYDMTPSRDPADDASAGESARLGTRRGSRWLASQMLRLGDGPSIELFTYHDAEQHNAATPSDLGIQHMAVYVDDMDEARQRVIDAGGTVMEGPNLLPGVESGDGNQWLYTKAPWGSVIELVSFPSPQPYEAETPLRRWRPAKSDNAPS